jgi:ferrous iron transport protein B
MGLASGMSLLVFFAIALMCVSTMAILSRESGSWRLPIQMFIAYGLAAYLGAVATFQLVSVFS